jgi:hypothetical protein
MGCFIRVSSIRDIQSLRLGLLRLQSCGCRGASVRSFKPSVGGVPLLARTTSGVSERCGRATSVRRLLLRVLLEIRFLCGGSNYYRGELHELEQY